MLFLQDRLLWFIYNLKVHLPLAINLESNIRRCAFYYNKAYL